MEGAPGKPDARVQLERERERARADVRLVDAEVLRVGPDEVLIVRLPQDTVPEVFHGLTEALELVGLAGRSLVLGLDAELAVAPKTDEPRSEPDRW